MDEQKRKKMEPSKWVIKLLRLLCHKDFVEEIEGDFLEKFHHDLEKYGYKAARKKMWYQLLSIVKPNLIFNFNQKNMAIFFNFKDKPHGLLFIAALLLMVVMLLKPFNVSGFTNQTMFSIQISSVMWLIPLFLFSFWILYLLTSKILYSGKFTRLHILMTVSAIMIITAIMYIGAKPLSIATRNNDLTGNMIQILSLVFILTQFIYFANILVGIFTHFVKNRQEST